MAYQSILNPHPVTGPLTDAQLRASPVPISGSLTISGGLTDTQLRASAVPISLASLPALATGGNVIGAVTQSGTWNVGVTGSVAVTGSFFQATQPVSIASMPSTPVTGTFWQATQPVSGTVTANAGSGTFAVSASSLPLPTGAAQDATLTGGTVKSINRGGAKGSTAAADVTSTASGANHQPLDVAIYDGSGNLKDPTQVRALTSSDQVTIANASLAVTGPLTDTQLRASAVPVSLASLPALVAGSALIGKVGLDQTTPGATNAIALAQIGSTTVASGNGVVGAGVQRVAIASDNTAFSVNAAQSGTWNVGTVTTLTSITNAVAVTAPTLTKGTQGANGWSVQHLKDAGRSTLCMTAEFTFAQVAETLLTLTLSADGAATSTFSSRVITNGKKFRIQSISATVESLGSGTAPQRAYLRLRRNTAGATTAASPLQGVWGFVNATAIVKSGFSMDYEVPDGLEMNGDGTGTFGFTLETPDWVTSTATGRIKITIIGVEF